MGEYDDEYEGQEDFYIEEKRNRNMQKIFCHTVYEECLNGGYVECEDIEHTIKYFSDREEYEKCIKLQKFLKKNIDKGIK